MHMPAILFVVEDYSVIKAPVSRSMAGPQNYCFLLDVKSSGGLGKLYSKLSAGVQCPVKSQVGTSFGPSMSGSIQLMISIVT